MSDLFTNWTDRETEIFGLGTGAGVAAMTLLCSGVYLLKKCCCCCKRRRDGNNMTTVLIGKEAQETATVTAEPYKEV